jgi:hypothetical protein
VFFLLTALILSACTASADPPDHAPGRVRTDDDQQHVAAGPLGGRTGAYLTLHDAAGRVEVRFTDLPGLLYRITTPPEAGLAPQVNGPAGHPRVRLRRTGGDGPETVRILLNRTVRWDIRLPAGGGEQRLDLRGGRLAGVRLGAAGLVVLNLPSPDRAVPITLSGPIGTCTLAAPAGTALRLRLRAGASRAVLPWAGDPAGDQVRGRDREAEPGETFAARGSAETDGGYDVDARGTIGTLTARELPSRRL